MKCLSQKRIEPGLRRNAGLFMLFLILIGGCKDEIQEPTAPQPAEAPSLAVAAAPLSFLQVTAGDNHACGVTTDNRAYCWGSGILGNGSVSEDQATPTRVTGTLLFRQISAGGDHTCALTTDNRAFCWGANSQGQLGDGTTAQRLTPRLVAGGLRFRQIDAGFSHSCALTPANKAYCWGSGAVGQLGNGLTQNQLKPSAVAAGGRLFSQVSAGGGHSCGVTTSAQAFCWGRGAAGQLGTSGTSTRTRPSLVVGGRSWRQLDAGWMHSCGVTTRDRVFCWGYGDDGEIGSGRYESRYEPTGVTTGIWHTCAETRGDKAYCWGHNVWGALGNDSGTWQSAVPIAVTGNLFFAQLSAGEHFTCGKNGSGTAYCWGLGSSGQLGDGTATNHWQPRPVAGSMY
jgi:alpha-tubulin suppressor-like RCC1 family protein